MIETVSGKEMNQVNISADEMALLRQGFYQVVNGGGSFNTGNAIGYGATVSISAKLVPPSHSRQLHRVTL